MIDMKKILLFLIIIIFTSGCYDYQEINNMAIIVGIGLDYKDDQYIMSYEILNIQKSNEEGEKEAKSYTITAMGKNVTEAEVNAEKQVAKKVSFSHLEILLIGNGLANHGLNDMADYFIRNNKITNNFFMVLVKNNTPEEIMSFHSLSEPINSLAIFNILKTSNTNISLKTKDEFDYQVATIKENLNDIVIPSVTLNKEIDLSNLAVFKGDKFKYFLTENEEQTYGIITKKINNNSFSNDSGTIEINRNNTNIDFKDNKININIKIYNKLLKLNDLSVNLKDAEDLNKLEIIYKEQLYNMVNKLLDNAKKADCDILGFKKLIYLVKPDTDFSNYNIEYVIDIKLHINRGGSLFEELT